MKSNLEYSSNSFNVSPLNLIDLYNNTLKIYHTVDLKKLPIAIDMPRLNFQVLPNGYNYKDDSEARPYNRCIELLKSLIVISNNNKREALK